jgi:hypothetical protein
MLELEGREMSEMSLTDAMSRLGNNARAPHCLVKAWADQQDGKLIAEIEDAFAAANHGHWVIYRAVKTLTDVPMNVKTFVTHFRGDCRCSRMR